MYILLKGYLIKGEKQSTEAIWDECNKNPSLQGALKSFALKSFKNREVGIYEVADKLLGYSLYEFSDAIKWLSTYPSVDRKRRLKTHKEIELLVGDDKNVYHKNLLDDYYPNRPDALNQTCLYSFDSWYEYKTKKCHDKCYELKNNLGFLHKRTKSRVMKVMRFLFIIWKSLKFI